MTPGGRVAIALVLAACALVTLPAAVGVSERRSLFRVADPAVRRMLVAGLGAGSAAAVLSLPPTVCVALAVGAAVLVRVVPMRRPAPDPVALRDLAGILDLIATCLDAGLAVATAIGAVLRATDATDVAGPITERPSPPGSAAADRRSALAEVAALLALGAEPGSAWRPVERHRELAGLAAAARRSAVGGVRLADAVRETAADLRRECRAVGQRGAARAGVAMTAPLALCFLPAFVCLGLAPVIVGMVSSLHLW